MAASALARDLSEMPSSSHMSTVRSRSACMSLTLSATDATAAVALARNASTARVAALTVRTAARNRLRALALLPPSRCLDGLVARAGLAIARPGDATGAVTWSSTSRPSTDTSGSSRFAASDLSCSPPNASCISVSMLPMDCCSSRSACSSANRFRSGPLSPNFNASPAMLRLR